MSLRINVFKSGRSELLSVLAENGVDFVERHPQPGTIVAAGETIEIVGILTPALCLLIGKSISSWLRKQSSRRVVIQMKSGKVLNLDARGYSTDQVKDILSEASHISVMQSKQDDQT